MARKNFSYHIDTYEQVDRGLVDYSRCKEFEAPMKLMNVIFCVAVLSLFAIYTLQSGSSF